MDETSIARVIDARPLPGAEEPIVSWAQKWFPHVITTPFAPRHLALLKWVEQLQPGVKPLAYIAIWPRGGGKSTMGELIACRLCVTLQRRFVMIVSGTQEQANKRVQAISALLERVNVERAVNRYGQSRGWKADLLRTANGFNVLAFGLDAASRGVKLDAYRPDFLFLDDVDNLHDTPKTTERKIETITQTVLPVGSPDCAVLFVQNRILDSGVMSRLADGSAEFLLERAPISEEPAIVGLRYERVRDEKGAYRYRITGGTPTWAGQDLSVCEREINAFGLSAFLREKQHYVASAAGAFFRPSELRAIVPEELPEIRSFCLAVDFAATEGAGDYTALVAMASDWHGRYFVLAVIRGQWAADRGNHVLELAANHFLPDFPRATLRIPQDPSAGGKRAALDDRRRFEKWNPRIVPVVRNKAARARHFAEQVNLGNVYLVCQDLPATIARHCDAATWQAWHYAFREELKAFRADGKHLHDDQVDAAADAFQEVLYRRTGVFA